MPTHSSSVPTASSASSTPAPSARRPEPPLSLVATRLGLRVLAPAAPPLAAWWAERMFLRASRHPRPAWEVEAMRGASRFEVGFGDGALPAWSFAPSAASGRHDGSGPRAPVGTVLLVHGWAGRGSQLGAFVRPLVDAGYRVVTYDGPGHGDAAQERTSIVELSLAVTAMATALGPLAGIIAHSVGGAATTLAAARSNLSTGRFVFVAPPTDPRAFAAAFFRHLGLGEDVASRVRDRLEQRYGLRMDELEAPRHARSQTAPLLVLHDEGDREVPLSAGAALADAWPSARLVVTEGLGHRRILRDPGVVHAAVGFVRGHAPRVSRITATPLPEPSSVHVFRDVH